MYYLKFIDEYGNESFYSRDFSEDLTKFDTVEDAEAEANKLIADEFDTFGVAVTRYFVVAVKETIVKNVDVFKVSDDKEAKTCIISATKDKTSLIDVALNGAREAFSIDIISDKHYKNGSRAVEFTYSVNESKYDAVITYSDRAFVLAYRLSDRKKMYPIITYLKEVYADVIQYYCDKAENGMCSMSFILSDRLEEFEKDLISKVKADFTVKVLKE